MDPFTTLVVPLAWPLATVIIALVFRRDLGQAMGRMGRVKYRDLELTFGDDLHRAEQMAKTVPLPGKGALVFESATDGPELPTGRLILPPSKPDASDPPDRAETNPRQAIKAAWAEVARASRVGRRMASASPQLVSLVNLLESLRDRADRVDQPSPSPEDAKRYADLARSVAVRFQNLP